MSDSYTQDLIAYDKLIERIADLEAKLKIAVEALELVEEKTITDPACEVELRSRAMVIHIKVSEALRKLK